MGGSAYRTVNKKRTLVECPNCKETEFYVTFTVHGQGYVDRKTGVLIIDKNSTASDLVTVTCRQCEKDIPTKEFALWDVRD